MTAVKKPPKHHHHTTNDHQQRHTLTLDEFQTFTSHPTLQTHHQLISLLHPPTLPMLYAIDVHHRGSWSLTEVLTYIEWAEGVKKFNGGHDTKVLYCDPVQAANMQSFYSALTATSSSNGSSERQQHEDESYRSGHANISNNGIESVTQWLIRCCQNCLTTPANNREGYLTYDHLLPLYRLIREYMTYGGGSGNGGADQLIDVLPDGDTFDSMGSALQPSPCLDFQSWFDLLQHSGEQLGTLDVEHSELDTYVPVGVVELMIRSILESVVERMRELGFG